MQYVTIDEIRDRYYRIRSGGHWFDPSALRFFRSRMPHGGYLSTDGKCYFVSSEQFEDSSGRRAERRYTVRIMDWATGEMDNLGETHEPYSSGFGAYSSNAAASRAALFAADGHAH